MPALANALGIEMETLMNGEMPVTQDFTGKEIKEYNFRQPDRYPRNMQRDLWMLDNRTQGVCKPVQNYGCSNTQ